MELSQVAILFGIGIFNYLVIYKRMHILGNLTWIGIFALMWNMTASAEVERVVAVLFFIMSIIYLPIDEWAWRQKPKTKRKN